MSDADSTKDASLVSANIPAQPVGSEDATVSSPAGLLRPLRQLPANLRRELESQMVERTFGQGDYLMRQGELGRSLMLIDEGHVEVRLTEGDNQHVLNRQGSGAILGEMALLTEEPRTASVVALTPVRARVLSAEDFHRLAGTHPALAVVMTHLVSERLGKALHDALAGKMLQGYTIRKRLGSGGMALVYEAQESETGRRVALKMMNHRLVYNKRALDLFKREADIVESFDHPNIARMFGRFSAFHSYFIVMELCDGRSLAEILRARGRLEETEARRILGQLALALSHAHANEIIHRDIKPSNVMVNRDGTVKLMDFGLARPLDHREAFATDWLVGTLPYMAPEMIAERRMSREADFYALGCVAYEMLIGRRAFDAPDFETLTRQHAEWKLPGVRRIRPGLDDTTYDLIDRCLVKEPQARKLDLQAIGAWAGSLDFDRLCDASR